jgi:hypothetical protein
VGRGVEGKILIALFSFIYYIDSMTVEQTVEIPNSRQLFIDVPLEVPVGKTILTFTPAVINRDLEYARGIWATNHDDPEKLKTKLQELQGSLGENAFAGLNGIEYQHKVREEWDN